MRDTIKNAADMPTFQVRSGYKAAETSTYRNPVSVDEMASYCDANSHITVRDLKGNARTVKVNGKVRRWKRDANRIEVPFKYGLYEYGILTGRDIVDVLIPVSEVKA